MTPFARIVAATLAILMASPFCCCFARHSDGDGHAEPSKHSCCSHRDEAPDNAPADNTCADCSAKTPRVADGGQTSSPVPVLFELGALPLDTVAAVAPVSTPVLTVVGIPPDLRRPPRLLLALQQRFLI